jgi:LPPG:FO 2-phospho-L-lactate transferase
VIVALAGGVGGARLADGLARVLPPADLTVVVNTGDDFEHLGLHVSPDLDTVMYTLAGVHNPHTGWGLAGETWNFLAALERLGGETWFKLGDRDLATHLERTRRLRAGASLSEVTAEFCRRLGIKVAVVPMSNDPVRTIVATDAGRLEFQDYFVRRQCAPRALGVEFTGAVAARISPGFLAALDHPGLEAVIVCPSNPFLSVAPILAVPGVHDRLARRRVPVVAVSPIIGGKAVKGPAAKLLSELGHEASAAAVAKYYGRPLDGFVLDTQDASLAETVSQAGVAASVTDTMMTDPDKAAALARHVVAFARELAPR